MHEALRSSKIIQEQPIVQELMGGIRTFLDGPHHVLRRRVMKALVRPAQLSSYRKAAEPALRDTMAGPVRPDAQSRPGCDLVDLLHQTFVRLGAAIIRLDGADTPKGRDELSRVFNPMPMAHNVKYLTAGRDKVINAALHAKSEYAMIFLNPAYERVLGEREARRASGERSRRRQTSSTSPWREPTPPGTTSRRRSARLSAC
jgi:cytochrome P450